MDKEQQEKLEKAIKKMSGKVVCNNEQCLAFGQCSHSVGHDKQEICGSIQNVCENAECV
jgi:hypothetical protein